MGVMPSWSIQGAWFAIATWIIALPDMVIVLLSAIGLGPQISSAIADDTVGLIANASAFSCALWLAFLFIIDFTDCRAPVQVLLGSIFLVLATVTAILKGIFYPWAYLVILLSIPAVILGSLRAQLNRPHSAVSRFHVGEAKHFYKLIGGAFTLCGLAVLLVWLVWLAVDGQTWGRSTRIWLAGQNTKVYEYVTPKDVTLSYTSHCNSRTKNVTSFSGDEKIKIAAACTSAESVWFIQWCSPLVAFICNMLCAVFCVLFSRTTFSRTNKLTEAGSTVSSASSDTGSNFEKLKKILKYIVLILSFTVASLYCSLYLSGASVRLGSAILCGAAVSTALVFGWVFLEVEQKELKELIQAAPMASNIAKIVKSDWMRAVAVGSLSVLIPMMMVLDMLRQKVRVCRAHPEHSEGGLFTKPGMRIKGEVAKWNWWSILTKVNLLAMLFALMTVGTKGTFVFFSALNTALSESGMSFTVISILVWAIGLAMFMCPIVPGPAVYLFAGVVLGAQSQLEGSVGFWPGMVVGGVCCSLAKMLACTGQYFIGYLAGKNVKVQQFVGVDKVPTRAMEKILKQSGLKLDKVCILVAGPDFPTSVLCGILQLKIPQMLMGTAPVILVSIIPQTLVGGLLTKGGADASLWAMISSAVTGLAAAIQAGATLFFTWAIMKTIEKDGKELAEWRAEHAAVAELTKSEEAFVNKFKEVTQWDQLGCVMQTLLLLSMVVMMLSGFIIAADFILSEKLCFRKFKITDSIAADYELGGLNGNALNVVIVPAGAIALALACIGTILHLAIGKRMNIVAQRRLMITHPE